MRPFSRSMVFALGLVMASGSVAHALNFCFNDGVADSIHDSLAVALKFHKPSKGTCSPITGFDIAFAEFRAVSGTACLNSSGDTLYVDYLVTSRCCRTEEVDLSIPYPSLSGGDSNVTDIPAGTGIPDFGGVHANPCIPQAIPIP
jgi:hypothetical protein